MNSHKDLQVWQESMKMVEDVYTVTNDFPAEERFNLTSQIRRSAVSVPSNISEGHDRKTDKEFIQFLRIAYGSSAELETQIILAKRLQLLSEEKTEKFLEKLTTIRKMLNKLISSINASNGKELRAKS